jgi:hypothetical protein
MLAFDHGQPDCVSRSLQLRGKSLRDEGPELPLLSKTETAERNCRECDRPQAEMKTQIEIDCDYLKV